MWNVEAIRLMDWATEENNRARAQKIVKVAEKMENTYRKDIGLPLGDIHDEYRQHCKWRETRPPKQ